MIQTNAAKSTRGKRPRGIRVDVDIDGTGRRKVARTFGEAADKLAEINEAQSDVIDELSQIVAGPTTPPTA